LVSLPERNREGAPPLPGYPVAGAVVSISSVDPTRATVDEVAAVSERLRGLISLRGPGSPAALLTPSLRLDGEVVDLNGAFDSTLVANCWPRLDANIGDLHISVTVVCASDSAGLLYHISMRATRELEATVAVELAVAQALLTIQSSRPLGHSLYAEVDPALRCTVVESLGASEGLAAAFAAAEEDASLQLVGEAVDPQVSENVSSVRANDGANPLRVRFERRCRLAPGDQQEFNLLCALAPERDGARAAVVAMRRSNPSRLLAEAEQEARRLLLRLPALPTSADVRLGERYRQNALFCYHFTAAEAIDTGRLLSMLTRSSHSPVCCLAAERELLLWALPVVTWLNPERARELLLQICARHARPTADAVRYLDGGRFLPGFQLDNACAYPIALSRYITTTGDSAIARHPQVAAVLEIVRAALRGSRHRDLSLYRTALTPSGLPATLPYLTYCNVLAWRAHTDLGWIGAENRHRDHAIAEEIRSGVYQELVDREQGTFLFAADLEGDSAGGDDPDGSLLWLPALGFCRDDDPIFRRTVKALFADDSPTRIPGTYAWQRTLGGDTAATAALGPALFGCRAADAVQIISEAQFAGGIACGAFDPASGLCTSGPHHAPLAGLLAWTLAESRALED